MATLAIAVHFGDHSYDGPFDALFNLIRYHDYPIEALPVARLTGDFLAYVRKAKDLEEELGEEFMEVASWLVLLKSRAIMPADSFPAATISPQEELQRVLLDRRKIADVSTQLKEREGFRPQFPLDVPVGREPDAECEPEMGRGALTVADALAAAERAVALAQSRRYVQNEDTLSVEDAGSWVRGKLAGIPIGTAISSAPWFEELGSPGNQSAVFLALLELARLGYVLLYQQHAGSRILVKQIREFATEVLLSS